MADEQKADNENGTRIDRIERVLELLVKNQLATQEHHDQEFKQLMIWQVRTQDQIEKLTQQVGRVAEKIDRIAESVDRIAQKVDRNSEMQAAFDQRVDKLVSAIGEFIRASQSAQRPPA